MYRYDASEYNSLIRDITFLVNLSHDVSEKIIKFDNIPICVNNKNVAPILLSWVNFTIPYLKNKSHYVEFLSKITNLLIKMTKLPKNISKVELYLFYSSHDYSMEIDFDDINIEESKEIKEFKDVKEECGICLDEKKMVSMNCKHKVCYDCYSKIDKCPFCRSVIDKFVDNKTPVDKRVSGPINMSIVNNTIKNNKILIRK